ncbi:hypothetical protein PQR36_13945 [Paraburkholderia nemoris]
MSEFATRFATSVRRAEILDGLLRYRAALRGIGILTGFQWVDGSFVEDVEQKENRAPRDIDVVTFGYSPVVADQNAYRLWFNTNLALFDRNQTKHNFECDGFYIDLRKRAELLVDDARYWFGLFSHQRDTSLWKGMVQVPLQSDDAAASALVANVIANP